MSKCRICHAEPGCTHAILREMNRDLEITALKAQLAVAKEALEATAWGLKVVREYEERAEVLVPYVALRLDAEEKAKTALAALEAPKATEGEIGDGQRET